MGAEADGVDFTPTLEHSDLKTKSSQTMLGWILPTLRTSEFTVLQTVGLDAAVVSEGVSEGRRAEGVVAQLLPDGVPAVLAVRILGAGGAHTAEPLRAF